MYEVFVYGSLKRNNYNNDLLKNSKFIDSATIEGINLHNGYHFPFAIDGSGTIHGEVYRINDETLHILDSIEDHPIWYKRERRLATLSDNKKIIVWIYLNEEAINYPLNKSGTWNYYL